MNTQDVKAARYPSFAPLTSVSASENCVKQSFFNDELHSLHIALETRTPESTVSDFLVQPKSTMERRAYACPFQIQEAKYHSG
jgi:hypothetical protein